MINTLRLDAAVLATGYLVYGVRGALIGFATLVALGILRRYLLAVIAHAVDKPE